jgi:hypothetical protein
LWIIARSGTILRQFFLFSLPKSLAINGFAIYNVRQVVRSGAKSLKITKIGA